jgi:coenzyme Q-binding protein COQ10
MPGATRSILINAPVEKVHSVIVDYDKYGEFLPEVKKVSTSNRQGNSVDVNYEVDVVKTIQYTLRLTDEGPNKVSWRFVRGEFMKDNHGHWTLVDKGGKTEATYTIEMALGLLVPKGIVNALVETQLPKMLEAFKARAEKA